ETLLRSRSGSADVDERHVGDDVVIHIVRQVDRRRGRRIDGEGNVPGRRAEIDLLQYGGTADRVAADDRPVKGVRESVRSDRRRVELEYLRRRRGAVVVLDLLEEIVRDQVVLELRVAARAVVSLEVVPPGPLRDVARVVIERVSGKVARVGLLRIGEVHVPEVTVDVEEEAVADDDVVPF